MKHILMSKSIYSHDGLTEAWVDFNSKFFPVPENWQSWATNRRIIKVENDIIVKYIYESNPHEVLEKAYVLKQVATYIENEWNEQRLFQVVECEIHLAGGAWS